MATRGLMFLLIITLSAQPLFADNITFKGDVINISQKAGGQLIILEGKATLESADFKINADKIELLGADFSEIRASGHVFLLSKVNKSEIKANRLNYYRLSKKMTATDNVSYSDGESLEIRCNYLEEEREGVYLMRGLVRLLKNSLFARSDSALYQSASHQLQLLGAAQVYQGDDHFSADRISVNTETEEIQMSGSVAGRLKGELSDE